MATKKRGIHINPKNKGKFNALKKRTGKTTEQLTHSKNPLTRKRAIFAQNAKKWKHEYGGELPFDLSQSFAQMNNLDTNTLAGTNNPGGKIGGSGLSFNPLSLGLSALSAIGGSVGANMATKRNELYEDAAEGMRPIDIKKATKGAGIQAFLQNPLTLGIGGRKRAELEAKEFNENIAKQQRNKDIISRFSTMSEAPTYSPVARQGGFIAYKGQTHDDPEGGILVDKMGNPTGVSQEKSVGIVEGGGKNKKGEVSYYEPESGSTYIYSDALGFAGPANGLLNKYKLNKPESLQYQQYKNDLLTKTMVDKKFANLRVANEFAKETGSSAEDSIGIFKKGGELSSSKAKEMLRDGTANGKKLTTRQKRYFGWVAGGRKEEGGLLPMYQLGGEEDGFTFDEQYFRSAGLNTNQINRIRRSQLNKYLSGLTKEQRQSRRASILGQPKSTYEPTGYATPYGSVTGTDYFGEPSTLEIQRAPIIRGPIGAPIKPTTSTGTGKPSITRQTLNPVETGNINLNAIDYYKEPYAINSGLAKGPVMPNVSTQEDINPWLNPLGHVLSGVGAIADYAALKRAKPTPVSAGRVGAERISLARQRLANTRNTTAARAMAGSAARSSGMNAGVALSNTLAANTGANRLLGQQNAELLQNEENVNAQMRQQANMVNAQLSSEEAAFNAQRLDAYNAMRARMNPVGSLARTAASYFADNAGYQQGYDTLQMLAPNAELYRDPNARWKRNPFVRPKVRLK